MNDLSLPLRGAFAAPLHGTLRDPRIDRLLALVPGVSGISAAILAAMAIGGYLSGFLVLAKLNPAGIAMKFNTAIGILLCAAALLALTGAPKRSRRLPAFAAAAAALSLGILTLAQYGLDASFGIDEWLIADPDPAGLPPGRPSPNSALNLVLLGAGLLALQGRSERCRNAAQALGFIALLVAVLSMLGQSYGGVSGVGLGGLDRMALSTALAFIALALGLLCAHSEAGWMALFASSGAGGHLMRTLLPVVILAPALLGWLRVEGQDLGLFDFRLGAALVAVASTALLGALVIWSARRAERIDRQRRDSHEALRQSEQFLQDQIRRLPIGYIVWGTDFRVVAWNPAAEAIFGYTAEQAIGRHAWELIVPASLREQIDAIWTDLLAGTGSVRSVNANRTRDGREIVCDWTNAPLQRGGRTIGVLSMVQDVTASQRIAEELRRQQQMLERTQALSRVGGWEYDVATGATQWTDEVYRIYEVTREQPGALAADCLVLLQPEARPTMEAAFAETLASGAAFDLELPARTAAGQPLWIRTVGVAEHAGDRVHRVVGHVMDITARKEAELAQQRYADRLRVVNRLDHVISSTFDLATVHEILVDELKRLFLFDRTSLVVLSADKSRWQILKQWTRGTARLEAKVWYEVHGSAMEWLAENRRTYFASSLAKPTFAEDAALRDEGLDSRIVVPLIFRGELLGAITLNSRQAGAYGAEDLAILESLADQLAIALNNARLYEQLQQQASLLERRVRERTAQLESAVKDLEGFSYSVSHDLRAPLRAIDAFSDILLQEHVASLDNEGRRLFGIVRENTAKMSRLIDDILSFSRAGRRDLTLTEVNLKALVDEVLADLRPDAGRRRIDIRIGDLPAVVGDRPALKQVLTNLLSNAIKFTGKRADPRIEVAGAVAPDNEFVVQVRDNGAGFDPQYAHKLFGVFQRLHAPEEFEGTGIGLAIVKRIVEKHGGRVWAEGRPGEGATFHLSLPRLTPGVSTGEVHG